jgi:tRNA A-37 threonylcarbamoyl transferase component Bud32
MPFQEGENVGPYRIIEQLGQGGMATVYKAYHPNLDRYVAIKVLHPAFRQDPQFLERFQREARVVAKLDHSNIVPVFDYADHNGQSYLVMKFIEGETLKAVLDRQWPSKEQILGIVRSVGSALTYAHRHGVLHRDVKPSNILLAKSGVVYLADFGLARIAEAGESTLSGDQLLGTPHYISPEQARGEKDLDEGTDIYSLGIVLYQLAVGRVPYSSDTPFSIIHDHIYTPLPMPRSINEKIPEDLERVLLKALAKDRSDRFASVQDMVEAFDKAARGISPWDEQEAAPAPVAVGTASDSVPDPLPEQAKDKSRSRRWAWVVGGLALSLFSLVTFGIAMGGAAGEPIAPESYEPVMAAGEMIGPTDHEPLTGAVEYVAPQILLFDRQTQGAIPSAWQWINEDPANPDAHFKLAQALAAEGDLEPAKSEFTKASELYMEQANYSLAAESLLIGLDLTGTSPGDDLKASNLLSQALFLGAESGDMFHVIDALYQMSPDWEPLEALDARSLLYVGQTEAATGMLDRMLAGSPENLFANAVMIDVLRQDGKNEQALQLTNKLLQRPRTPPWLDQHLLGYQVALSS